MRGHSESSSIVPAASTVSVTVFRPTHKPAKRDIAQPYKPKSMISWVVAG
jgi:hypothetical protein